MAEQQLLQEYTRTEDQAAFARLVSANINFVYSCAKRQVRDAHLAEDVTQVVFMILAKKAGKIASEAALPGWLFNTTRFVASDVLRANRRRQRHEREAAQMFLASHIPDQGWQEMEPYLDEALAALGAHERDAVLLRYFRGMSLQETGAALGIPENTAAKRISRAIERLRNHFARRGIKIAAPAIVTGLGVHAVQAAPPALAATIAAATVGPLGIMANEIIRAMAWAKVKFLMAMSAAVVTAAAALLIALQMTLSRTGALPPPPNLPAAFAATQIRAAWGPEWAAIPIAPGWPVAVPGHVTSTPAAADLDGDGDLEIIVPSMTRTAGTSILHPTPTLAATLYAFHHDGKPVKGWPVVLLDESARRQDRFARPNYSENWAASPSVADLDGDGRDEIIITAPANRPPGSGRSVDQTHILNGDGSRRTFPQGLSGGEVWSSFPIADLNGDGKLDLLCHNIVISADGKPVPGWNPPRAMFGFAPCAGDANGDGAVELFYCSYVPEGMLYGLDRTGKIIPGWPQETTRQCLFPPVMGDVNGDGKMEIFALDQGGHLLAWAWNGRPLIPGYSADGMKGIFKDNIAAHSASPTLADLDGDGRPEIIIFDHRTQSLKAWRGDGQGLFAADGTLVRLPEIIDAGGVTVGDLGGDGVMDLFVGVYWVQLARDGKTTITKLLPRSQAPNSACLITDIDRDGKADLVFGLADGQVFVYQTGKAYKSSWMQWPANNGNQRHTGAWQRPSSE
jgi:RNA polymerase sigma factor (sigma-70 family)